MNRKTLIVMTLLLFILLLVGCREKGVIQGEPADPNNLPDIVGVYAVNGVDAAGENYGGTLAIEPGDAPNSYRLHWIVTGAVQEGEAHIEGNQLKGVWWTIDGVIQAKGKVVYTITTLGELDGKRMIDGFEEKGWEKAFPNDENWGKFKFGH